MTKKLSILPLVFVFFGCGESKHIRNSDREQKLEAPLAPNFASIKANLLDKKCLSCHGVGGEAARIPLNSRDEMVNSPLEIIIPKNADESGLVLVLLDGAIKKMPPKNSGMAPVTPGDIDVVKEWINNGATD